MGSMPRLSSLMTRRLSGVKGGRSAPHPRVPRINIALEFILFQQSLHQKMKSISKAVDFRKQQRKLIK